MINKGREREIKRRGRRKVCLKEIKKILKRTDDNYKKNKKNGN